MNRRLVQGSTLPSPCESWNRIQQTPPPQTLHQVNIKHWSFSNWPPIPRDVVVGCFCFFSRQPDDEAALRTNVLHNFIYGGERMLHGQGRRHKWEGASRHFSTLPERPVERKDSAALSLFTDKEEWGTETVGALLNKHHANETTADADTLTLKGQHTRFQSLSDWRWQRAGMWISTGVTDAESHCTVHTPGHNPKESPCVATMLCFQGHNY